MGHCIGDNLNIHIWAWFDIEFHLSGNIRIYMVNTLFEKKSWLYTNWKSHLLILRAPSTKKSSVFVVCWNVLKPLLETVKIQIRLLLLEQSDLGPHCLPLQLYLPINRHFSDAVILLAFQRFNDMLVSLLRCYCARRYNYFRIKETKSATMNIFRNFLLSF